GDQRQEREVGLVEALEPRVHAGLLGGDDRVATLVGEADDPRGELDDGVVIDLHRAEVPGLDHHGGHANGPSVVGSVGGSPGIASEAGTRTGSIRASGTGPLRAAPAAWSAFLFRTGTTARWGARRPRWASAASSSHIAASDTATTVTTCSGSAVPVRPDTMAGLETTSASSGGAMTWRAPRSVRRPILPPTPLTRPPRRAGRPRRHRRGTRTTPPASPGVRRSSRRGWAARGTRLRPATRPGRTRRSRRPGRGPAAAVPPRPRVASPGRPAAPGARRRRPAAPGSTRARPGRAAS